MSETLIQAIKRRKDEALRESASQRLFQKGRYTLSGAEPGIVDYVMNLEQTLLAMAEGGPAQTVGIPTEAAVPEGMERLELPVAYSEVEYTDGTLKVLTIGQGPEAEQCRESDNPNWLWQRAANCVALARWLEAQKS